RIDRIPKTRHRWIKIVSLLTSLGFNLKTKLRTKKSIQNTVFTECLHFKFVKLKTGKVVTSKFGKIDFTANNIGIEIIKTLYENGFPYLEITEEGKVELYGTVSKMENVEMMIKPGRGKNQYNIS
ncbi:MAG TPA: hypothetical protein VIK55_14230, partial [Paludibacter sp.]